MIHHIGYFREDIDRKMQLCTAISRLDNRVWIETNRILNSSQYEMKIMMKETMMKETMK